MKRIITAAIALALAFGMSVSAFAMEVPEKVTVADLNEQAEDMFFRTIKKLAEKESITETFKAENQMLWVQRMNAIREMATEIVNNDLIYV